MRYRHVRIGTSTFPGEHPVHDAWCVTCGTWLGQSPRLGRTRKIRRRHERDHARMGGR